SAYCAASPSCTAAVVKNNVTAIRNTAVSDLWASLSKTWTLPRSMISQALPGSAISQGNSYNTTTSLGSGNYNALFVTARIRDWHGVTATSNFTWGRALGTGTLGQANSSNTALDVWDMHANYGINNFDIKFIYNIAMFYQPKIFVGQKGVLGKVLGGWTVSPLFTAQSGAG